MVRLACARPVLTVCVATVLAALGVGYAAHSLTLETSKFHLLPLHLRYATLYKDYAEDFGQLEDLVVVVESPDVATSTAYAARLATDLRAGALGTARISYRIDASRFAAHALLYLPLDTLRNTLDTVATHEDLLADFAATPTLARLVDGINQAIGGTFLPGAFGPGGPEPEKTAPTRLLRDLLTQMSEGIDGGPYRSPWAALLGVPIVAPEGGYFLSNDRRLLYLVIDLVEAPRTFAAEHAAIIAVRGAIQKLRPQFPSVEAGVTGAPALFSDELSTATRDGEIASVLALVLTLGLLILAFRRLVTSCAILVVLALSLGWALGVITLLVGQLTIFSMMFVSVVIGLGSDYGIFFLFRYREERALGRRLVDALEQTAARSGPGILLGTLTAAVTFYILITADFRGIRDFGFISGTAILLAFLSMLTVFPAVLLLIDRWKNAPRVIHPLPDVSATQGRELHVPALEWLVRYPKTIVTATVLVTAVSIWAAPRAGFDYNLLNLQADGTESVVWERKAAAAAGRSVFAALSTATSLPELEARQVAFQSLPSVSDVQSVLSVLPDRQAEKLAVLERLADVADGIRPGAARPLDLRVLTGALETLKRRLDVASAPRGGDAPPEEVLAIARATSALLERLKGRDRNAVEVALADYQARLAGDFAQQWGTASAGRPAGAAHARRPSRGAAEKVHRQERPPVAAGLFASRPLGRRQPGALRRGLADGGPGRHRPAGGRPRVHAAHRAVVPIGTRVRLRARRRDRGAHDPSCAGDGARHRAADPRHAVDGRHHAVNRPQAQSGQRLGAAAHHRLCLRVRREHRSSVSRSADVRRTTAGPEHRDERGVQRPHDHRRFRQLARRAPSGHVEPGLAARHRLGGNPDRLAGGAPHAGGARRRAPNSGGRSQPRDGHRGRGRELVAGLLAE